MKKKTPTQKYIDKALKKAVEDSKATSMIHCNFVGVQFDAKATEAITTIAEGLIVNAQALGDLAQALKASNVTIESMVKMGSRE